MRWVFYGLLVLNLLYFMVAMLMQTVEPPAEKVSAIKEGVEQVRLVKEVPEAVIRANQSIFDALQEDADTSAAPEEVCEQWGPFIDSVAQRFSLPAVPGLVLDENKDQLDKEGRYWLYLPPFASRIEALKAMAQLAETGIDGHLLKEEPLRHALSLGLFDNEQQSLDLKKRLIDAGFAPILEQKSDQIAQYWLTVRYPDGESAVIEKLTVFEGEIRAQYPQFGRLQKVCGTVASP